MQNIWMSFLVYGVVGWIWESFYCSIKAKHYVYRGFLLGPYCPVYGFGVVSVLLLVPKDYGSLLNLYFNSIVIVTIIEFLASYLLEKLFNMVLWDYTNVPFNIEGRVAVPVSAFWGIGCVFLITIIHPEVEKLISYLSQIFGGVLPIILFIVFVLDVATTLIYTTTMKQELNDLVDTSDSNNAAVKEYRLKHLVVDLEESVSRKRVLDYLNEKKPQLKHRNLNRIVRNYPNFKLKKK